MASQASQQLAAERVKLLAGSPDVSASAKPQMKVPFLDLKAHHAPLIGQFDRAIREVIESSAFAGGPFVERFEEEFAAYCGSSTPSALAMAQTRFGLLSWRWGSGREMK